MLAGQGLPPAAGPGCSVVEPEEQLVQGLASLTGGGGTTAPLVNFLFDPQSLGSVETLLCSLLTLAC